MPNWCYNDITISHNDKKYIDAVIHVLENDGGLFNHLNPDGDWGTKWDADITHFDKEDNSINISFNTAWCPPINLYDYMLKQKWHIEALYEESGCCFVGKYEDGKDECYEYDFDDDDWKDIPDELKDFADLDEQYKNYIDNIDDKSE